jgi:hypothetical protein
VKNLADKISKPFEIVTVKGKHILHLSLGTLTLARMREWFKLRRERESK